MKFKEQRGSVFVFDGGYAGGELELVHVDGPYYEYKDFYIDIKLNICTTHVFNVQYADIQTAVNLMQILIDEVLA